MDNIAIINFLEENGVSEIEELQNKSNYFIIKFYYDFDNEELSAARAYANEESDLEEESDEWYSDWYYSYLYDLAKDNLEEVFEELNEEYDTSSYMKLLSNDSGNGEYVRLAAIICDESYNEDLEEELNDYV